MILSSVLALKNHQYNLKMGKKLDAETSESLNILMQRCARGNFVVYMMWSEWLQQLTLTVLSVTVCYLKY